LRALFVYNAASLVSYLHRCGYQLKSYLTFDSSPLVGWVLAVLVVLAVILSLWHHESISTIVFKFKSSLDIRPSDVFFPVIDTGASSPARENTKTLNALVTSIEHRNCSQNQTKGSSISNCCTSVQLTSLVVVVILASSYFQDHF
jgi:hypothetical protein